MTEEKTGKSKQADFHTLPNILFIASALLFNISVSGVYLATKLGNQTLQQGFGLLVVLLVVPFSIIFLGYLKEKAGVKILASLTIILLYLFVELLLDYILKIPFRDILLLHIPYIILFYAASFSILGISFNIHRNLGYAVTITFLFLIGCLVYLYLG
jgi:hypothetical protein